MEPLITVVMPAYNAEATIETALKSIRMQTVADRVEILVIDGGSTDNTRKIALQYGAVVLDNPRRLPEPAKLIGIRRASGRYVVEQDTDEELLNPNQLEKRLDFFSERPNVKCLVCDRQFPGSGSGLAAQYICACGDPFTQFVYRRKDGVAQTFWSSSAYSTPEGIELRFQPGDPVPIGDGGTTMFDIEWVKQQFPRQWDDIRFVCSLASHVIAKTGCCGCLTGDDIRHHVQAGFWGYLSKLRFRVINNLFHPEESGYSARVERAATGFLSRRKYLFVLYAATLLGPLADSVRLAWHYRDASMLLHVVYVYYVCLYVAYCLVLSWMKKTRRAQSYGK